MRLGIAPLRLAAGLVAFGVTGLALLAPQVAEAKFVFPYNHTDLDWYTIETEHFFVHYPISHNPEKAKHPVDATFMAQRTAKVSEEMWEPMCSQFDYYLTEKIHIVLLDQSDNLEGFTIPAWNWITISGYPGDFFRWRGRMEWFSDVLVHEFAHVVSLKRNAALGEGAQAIVFGGLFSDGINDMETGAEFSVQGASEPFWWSEGGAEYWSDRAGYNWWTTSRDATLRGAVLDDRMLTYEEWVTRDRRDWFDGEHGYQAGYSFGLYLRERFGPDIYAELSKNSGKKFRFVWEDLLGDLTGVPPRELYADWRKYLDEKYGKVKEDVVAQGHIEGHELELSRAEWDTTDPDAREKFFWQGEKSERKARMKREEARFASGRWDHYPRISPDGKWIAEAGGWGLEVMQFPEDALPAISGEAGVDGDLERVAGEKSAVLTASGYAFDFVPGKDQVVVTAPEDFTKTFLGTTALAPEWDGYSQNQLYIVDLTTKADKRKHHDGKEEYDKLAFPMVAGAHTDLERYHRIPNTIRGQDPDVSPDGTRVAYVEYADGNSNIVVINLDGSNKIELTTWKDGSWPANPTWSPDGTKLVFSMLRNFRVDLWTIDVATKEIRALNRDIHEDIDPYWAADGNIYFSSDPTGIFNVYRYEPATGNVTQITNVLGRAECPWLTPQGNLFYTNKSGYGWKSFALPADDFYGRDATADFDFTPVEAEWKADLAFSEDIVGWFEANKDKTDGKNPITTAKKYPLLGEWMSPAAFPMFRLENDSQTNWGISAGGQLYAQDFVENQTVFGMALIGEDPLAVGAWTWQGLPINVTVQLMHYEAKYDYGFLIDDDNDSTTTNDQSVWEGKQNQYVNRATLFLDRPINASLHVSAYASTFEYGFRGTDDIKFAPYIRGTEGGASLSYDVLRTNGGGALELNLGHARTDIVYGPYNGHDSDDGMVLDKYDFNRLDTRLTLSRAIPTFGSKALASLRKAGHAVTADFQVGYIDRNVSIQDEYRGGGTHPYYMGSGNLRPNNQFSGFPGYSLSGETMAVLYGGYRFPVARHIDKRWGPLYLQQMTAQVGGTTGNFWSFRAPTEAGSFYTDAAGQHVAYNEDDVQREIPFVDKAQKNGNFLLYDLNAELRVKSMLFGENGWDSFVRLAWGFNEVGGIGDVNGDDIQDTSDNGVNDALSNETEMPGPRIYIGFGTGW